MDRWIGSMLSDVVDVFNACHVYDHIDVYWYTDNLFIYLSIMNTLTSYQHNHTYQTNYLSHHHHHHHHHLYLFSHHLQLSSSYILLGSLNYDQMNTNFRRALDCFVLNPSCIAALDTYDTCGWRLRCLDDD